MYGALRQDCFQLHEVTAAYHKILLAATTNSALP